MTRGFGILATGGRGAGAASMFLVMFAAPTRCSRRGVLVVGALATLLALGPARSAAAHGDDGAYTSEGYDWQPLVVGTGGRITDLAIADDGVLVARSDAFGAFTRAPSDQQWTQLISATSLPSTARATVPASPAAVAVAPSDATVVYAGWAGRVFASDDGGTTFGAVDFAATSVPGNIELTVDPADPESVLASPPGGSLRVSRDGGHTWSLASTSRRLTEVTFDRSSERTPEGRTSVAYAIGSGRGIYRTANGGTRWTAIGGPKNAAELGVGADGSLWAITGAATTPATPATLMRYDATAGWVDITPPAWTAEQRASGRPLLAVDPVVPGAVVAGDDEQLFSTRSGGMDWTALSWTETAGDLPRTEPAANQNAVLAANDLLADPSKTGRLWLATDSGVQYADLAEGSSALTWVDHSRGIESRTALDVVTTRFGGPILLVAGYGPFAGARNSGSPARFPGSGSVTSTSLDSPSTGSSFVVATGVANQAPYQPLGMYSTTGASWRTFRSMPRGATTAAEFGYGTIAAASNRNFVWAPGAGPLTTSTTMQPYYTLDQGRSWEPVNLPGITDYSVDLAAEVPLGLSPYSVAADRVRQKTFYLHVPGTGLFATSDGGADWELVHAGPLGAGQPDTTGVLEAIPGERGGLIFASDDETLPLLVSDDAGATWSEAPGVDRVAAVGFGAASRSLGAHAVYLAGDVDGSSGIWRSDDLAHSWTRIGDVPGSLDAVTTIGGDPDSSGTVYVGLAGSSFVIGTPLPPTPAAATTASTRTSATTS